MDGCDGPHGGGRDELSRGDEVVVEGGKGGSELGGGVVEREGEEVG